ncbi:hypothetical protein SMZ63_002759 [Cronobacter sakazakii]|nr:hypothetical protein [Cronobacter sakazakii]ELY4429639.1 hypothetical protein [Cronobacter sakazakii]ELY4456185.1 hypothetical protein [Cronobacter sakazakii]ELY4594577.1 hypothetical protein [Cronobacter sakazakii]
MSELNELIASEIADFFAGFGGPGEPDVQSGEAQRLLTERLLSVLALRERAEPVYQVQAMDWHDVEKYLYDEALDRGIRCRVLYTAPTAPVVPEDVLAALRKVVKIRLDFNDFDGDRRGMADCLGEAEEALIEVVNRRAAMIAAPGKEG